MTHLTENFTLEELCASPTARRLGIDNTPNPVQFENLLRLCENVLQPLRDAVGRPVVVTSGFRCAALNAAVGGARHSQHICGQAADLVPPTRPADCHTDLRTRMAQRWNDLCEMLHITAVELPFDQLIVELRYRNGALADMWMHVSFKAGSNRRQILLCSDASGSLATTPVDTLDDLKV